MSALGKIALMINVDMTFVKNFCYLLPSFIICILYRFLYTSHCYLYRKDIPNITSSSIKIGFSDLQISVLKMAFLFIKSKILASLYFKLSLYCIYLKYFRKCFEIKKDFLEIKLYLLKYFLKNT